MIYVQHVNLKGISRCKRNWLLICKNGFTVWSSSSSLPSPRWRRWVKKGGYICLKKNRNGGYVRWHCGLTVYVTLTPTMLMALTPCALRRFPRGAGELISGRDSDGPSRLSHTPTVRSDGQGPSAACKGLRGNVCKHTHPNSATKWQNNIQYVNLQEIQVANPLLKATGFFCWQRYLHWANKVLSTRTFQSHQFPQSGNC